MLRTPLTAALLTWLAMQPAIAVTPCRVDGKIIYTRECILQQRGNVSTDLHRQQASAIEGSAPSIQEGLPTSGQPDADAEARPVISSKVRSQKAASKAQGSGQQSAGVDSRCQQDMLFEAARKDLVHVIKACPDTKLLRTLTNKVNRTLIHQAADSGSHQTVAYLLSKNPDLSAQAAGDRGATPLHLAAERNHTKVIRMLLQAGADIEARDFLKRTALHCANSAVANKSVRLLIRLRADIHSTDRAARTPLLVASQQTKSHRNIEALLDAGADINHTTSRQMTALHYATLTDTRNTELLLSRGAALNVRDTQGRTPALLAAIDNPTGNWDRIKLLVEAGANLNAKDDSGDTLLKVAYRQQHEGLLKLLLKHGVDTRNVARVIERYEAQPKDKL